MASLRSGCGSGCGARGCSGLSYTIEYADEKGKFDEIVEDKGVTVLIDPKAVMFILGTEMDYVEENLAERLHLSQPERKRPLRLRQVRFTSDKRPLRYCGWPGRAERL